MPSVSKEGCVNLEANTHSRRSAAAQTGDEALAEKILFVLSKDIRQRILTFTCCLKERGEENLDAAEDEAGRLDARSGVLLLRAEQYVSRID